MDILKEEGKVRLETRKILGKLKVDFAVSSMLLSQFGVFRVLGGKKIYLF